MSSSIPAKRLPPISALSWDDCRLLVESVADYAIFMLDPNGYVATWNLGAERIEGYKAEEIIGKHFSTFYPRGDVEAGKIERELTTARQFGRDQDEGWRIRKDGSRFWADVVITCLRDHSEMLRGFAIVTKDLTQRRLAEERLLLSELRFHQLVDAAIDYAIFLLDGAGHVSTWNTGATRTKGYSADEIIGKHFSVFYTEEDRAAGKPERILNTVRREGRYEEENWRVRKDGSLFWANVVITALRDAHGELIGFAKVTRDLTPHRNAEEVERKLLLEQAARAASEEAETRLRDSEERYRALSNRLEVILDGIADGITVQDRSGRLIFANTTAAKICGFESVDQLLNATIAEILARFEIHDDRGRPFDLNMLPGRQVLRGESAEKVLVHTREIASGCEWWSLVRARAVPGCDGTPELAVNIWKDVTAERRREQEAKHLGDATAALASSLNCEEMLSLLARAMVPSLSDWCAIHLLEADQLRTVAVAHSDPAQLSSAKEYLERFPPDARQARGLWNVLRTGQSELYDDMSPHWLEQVARSAEHLEALQGIGMKSALVVPIRVRGRVTGTITLVSAESGRRFDWQHVALAEELGRRAGSAVENAKLYAAERDAVRRAEDANRLKDEFLATVSHELRTPLNAILGWSTLLIERGLDPSLRKGLEVIRRNAESQGKIVEDILDASRIIAGKLRLTLKPTDLVALVVQAVDVVRPSAAAKRISLEFASSGERVLVGDPERLRQVVWNLLSNAVKFTEPHGKVVVSIEQSGSSLTLSVRDTGRGIEPDFLPYVFERFKQEDSSTTRRFGGLGLGLAIVRHIVELHGGRVWVESEGKGKGALFNVGLPIRAIHSEDKETQSDTAWPQPRHVCLGGLRVLVVDDDADARELLGEVLLRAGAVVETAESAATGFDAVRRFRPHILISDVGMPEEDGYSFVRRVRNLDREQGGAIPSVALTAYTRNEDRTKAIAAGFTTYIAKPVNPEDLVAAVSNLATFARR